jgi:hypothetical protein
VSQFNTNRTTSGMVAIGARAKDAAAQAVPVGKRAGTTAVQGVRQGVQGAREWAVPRMVVAILGARQWAAPQLENAADAVTVTVAPKVSTMLRSAASQVRPDEPASAKTGIRSLLNWRWLLGIGAAAAAAGTTAAIAMRRRYAAATAEAKEATESPGDEDGPDTDPGSEAAARSEVNGQVTTPRKVT